VGPQVRREGSTVAVAVGTSDAAAVEDAGDDHPSEEAATAAHAATGGADAEQHVEGVVDEQVAQLAEQLTERVGEAGGAAQQTLEHVGEPAAQGRHHLLADLSKLAESILGQGLNVVVRSLGSAAEFFRLLP